MRIFISALMLISLTIGGCSTTTSQMRADPDEKGTFHVGVPYKDVYLYFVARARQCFDGQGTNAVHYFVTAEENIPGKSATVEMVQDGMARRVMLSADIVAAGDETDVAYYKSGFSVFANFRPILMEWSNGTGSRCGRLFE